MREKTFLQNESSVEIMNMIMLMIINQEQLVNLMKIICGAVEFQKSIMIFTSISLILQLAISYWKTVLKNLLIHLILNGIKWNNLISSFIKKLIKTNRNLHSIGFFENYLVFENFIFNSFSLYQYLSILK